jgi:hypothetical protein
MKGKQFGGHIGDTVASTAKFVVLFLAASLVLMFIIGAITKASKQGFSNYDNKSQDSMFLFANNKSKPSCCNFSYSSSNGCVCITKEQQMLLHTRGGNRTTGDEF